MRVLLRIAFCALCIACCGERSWADMSARLPANHPLIEPSVSGFRLAGKSAADAKVQLVGVTGQPFDQGLHVVVPHRPANDYDVQLALPLPSMVVQKGDIIWFSLWARMLSTGDESGQGLLGIILEQNHAPYDKLLQQRISIDKTWQEFAFPARIDRDQPTGSLHLVLRLGGAAQTLELAHPQLLELDDPASVQLNQLPQTRMTYGGRAPDAPWRKAADERIDRLRKARLTVRVVDASGHPVAGVSIRVEMTQHAFPFGCVYDPALIAGPASQTAAGRQYAQHFLENFNVGVDEYAMKWPDWEKPADRTLAIQALDWMTAHGVRVRGHCLVWPGWGHLPTDLRQLQHDPTALARRVDDHIRDEVGALAGRLTEWDVVNEPYVNNDLMKILGYPVMADWFKIAHATDPAPRLLLNETSVPTNPPSDPHYNALFEQVQAFSAKVAPSARSGCNRTLRRTSPP